MSYKKSLLSLATILALSGSAMADSDATYLPLSSDTADAVWVLFGVNGFSDGTPSDIGTSSGSFTAGFTSLEDTTTTDTLATSGLAAAAGSGDMATLQDVSASGSTTLLVGVDMTGTVFDITEPIRTMYIKVGSGASTPNVKFDYKASLEGKAIEILLDGTLYNTTISQSSTWYSAVTASTGASTGGGGASDRTLITEALDYNLSNNPSDPVHFDSTVHQNNYDGLETSTNAQTASIYHFNSVTQQWEVWNQNSPTNGNDFTTLAQGNAYWGRVDLHDAVGGTLTNDADGAAGLVLGRNTTGTPDYTVYNGKLAAGWNMLAFDDSKPDIRHAATGLITYGWAASDAVQITDDSGINDLNVTLTTANSEAAWATQINEAIESAKLLGTVPSNFNIKAFAGEDAADNNGTIVFISDRKFSLDTNASGAIVTTTLAGQQPYVTATGLRSAIPDLDVEPATSAYGEYTMMLDIMTTDATGTNTAAELDSLAVAGAGKGGSLVSAKILFGDSSGDDTAIPLTNVADANPDVNSSLAQIRQDDIFDGTSANGFAIGVDTNSSGQRDKIIVASTSPFYVKDNTFVRVFTVDATEAVGGTLTIDNTTSATITAPATPTAANIRDLIIPQSDDGNATNVYAAVGTTASELITVATNNSSFDLKDTASETVDNLTQNTSSSHDIAKGAIGGAYSLDHVAALPLTQHTWTALFASNDQPDDLNDGWDINISLRGVTASINSNDFNATAAAIVNTAAGRKAYFDLLVGELNRMIKSATGNHHAYATHDFTTATDDLTGSKILISGVDVTNVAITGFNGGGGAAQTLTPSALTDTEAARAGTMGTGLDTGDLVADVKSNAIHTRDFAIYGPLYTLNSAGYDVRAIIKATTELDSNTGSIAWDSIDITRTEDEWFNNNEYNLFKIDHNQGYWVYLDAKSTNVPTISSATITSPGYSYYFEAASPYATTNVINSGTLSVTITGLEDAAAGGDNTAGSAYATIGGQEVQLRRTGTSDVFTADLSDYALTNFSSGASVAVDVRAVNGKGQSASSSSIVTVDYVAPTNMAATASSVNNIALSADGNASNFYVFNGAIPEVETARTTATIATVPATNSAATYSACADSAFSFGTTYNLRIVAADGAINSSNVSDATAYTFAPTLKGSHVLTHEQDGSTLKTQIGTTYDSSCVATTTQPSAVTDNDGVSVTALVANETVSIAFVPDANSNFTQDLAWTSNYALTGGGTAIMQIQSTSAYAGDTFYVSYNGNLYTGTFPATQSAADVSVATTTLGLSLVTNAGNTSLIP